MSKQLLQVKDLMKHFPIKGGLFSKTIGNVHAVDGINLNLDQGKTMGLVGESGCGKTTVGRCVLRLIEPTSGEVWFEGVNLLDLKEDEMRNLRRQMQIVFQDPYASLNPRWLAKDIVGEPLIINRIVSNKIELENSVLELLMKVGLSKDHLNRFPHEFSGGQRQRIGIARALALRPRFLVLDEPTSSLDVSVQAQILNLLKELQNDLELTYLFISHNLSVIKHVSDTIGVMYLGKIVEICPKGELFKEPLHPYTKALLSAIPVPDPEIETKRVILGGVVPSSLNPPKGCRFHSRCISRLECPKGSKEEPQLKEVSKGHLVACFMAQ